MKFRSVSLIVALFAAATAVATGPKRAPECALPAGGCSTGLDDPTSEPLCSHDPGADVPDAYLHALDDYNGTCLPPATPAQPCKSFWIDGYEGSAKIAWDKYRQRVCNCWAEFPSESDSDRMWRTVCLNEANELLQAALEDDQKFYKGLIDACECVNPQ